MRNKLKPLILLLLLLMLFQTAGEGYSATDKQNSAVESADRAKPAPERKARSNGANKEPGVFVPTEKISADKGISFPTDI